MIIKKLIEVLLPKSQNTTQEISDTSPIIGEDTTNYHQWIEDELSESLVDKEIDTSKKNYSGYTGVPAPVYLEDDPWFGPAVIKSQKQIDYMQQEMEVKRKERESNFSIESGDIHQKMYEIATQNTSTTLQLDLPGGSENFQQGWNSGTGLGQFK